MPEPSIRLGWPERGLRDGDLALRLPREEDVDDLLPALALGILRVEAYVNVGNDASDRVLERAGYTREGVVRSLPRPDSTRVDKTLWSLLPGE